MEWLDEYEIRARIIPSLIILLPLMIPIYLFVQDVMATIASLVFSGTIFFSFLYTVSFFVRKNGSNLEKKLWAQEGASPSTRILRWSDNTLSPNTKKQLHEAVKQYCHIDLASKEEEQNDPIESDKKIQDAFNQVKNLVYYDDPNGKWNKFNAEYGFNRNLLGSKWYWFASTIIGIVFSWVLWCYTCNLYYIYGLIINFLLFFMALLWTAYLLPNFVVDPANYYALAVWNSFLVIMKKDDKIM